jgi:serine/threonine protein kinase
VPVWKARLTSIVRPSERSCRAECAPKVLLDNEKPNTKRSTSQGVARPWTCDKNRTLSMVAPQASSPCESSSTFLVEKVKIAPCHSSSSALWILGANDVALGDPLGEGSFCTVHKARILPREDATGSSSSSSKVYALKKLSESSLTSSPVARANAINDLRNEANILSMLPRHRNIIRLHALSNNFWTDSTDEDEECPSATTPLISEPFLVLEMLVETLHDRLHRIRKQDMFKTAKQGATSAFATRLQSLVLPPSHESRRSLQQVQLSRLYSVGLPVCHGVAFLHRHNVVLRDLKPSNIGFDAKGRVKLLDFGFARVVPKGSNDDDNDGDVDGRIFTGPGTGTVRYMAPEVMRTARQLDRGCDLFASDVYSLSVVLWELVTTHKPFADIRDVDAAESMVTQKGARPPLRLVESKAVRAILKAGWDASPDSRPSAVLVRSELQACVAAETKPASSF